MKYFLALAVMWLLDLSGTPKQSEDNYSLLSKAGFWWTSALYDLNPDLCKIDTLKLTYEEPARPDSKRCIILNFTCDSLIVSLPSTMDTTWYPENIQPKQWQHIIYSVRDQEGFWFWDRQRSTLKYYWKTQLCFNIKYRI